MRHLDDFWPPPGKPVFCKATLFKLPDSLEPYTQMNIFRSYFLIFWTIEDGEITWKDCHTKQKYYQVRIEAWWNLHEIDPNESNSE